MVQNSFSFEIPASAKFTKCSCSPSVFSEVLSAQKTNLITARAHKNKRTARMFANTHKDQSIPLIRDNYASKTFFCQSFFIELFLKMEDRNKIYLKERKTPF